MKPRDVFKFVGKTAGYALLGVLAIALSPLLMLLFVLFLLSGLGMWFLEAIGEGIQAITRPGRPFQGHGAMPPLPRHPDISARKST